MWLTQSLETNKWSIDISKTIEQLLTENPSLDKEKYKDYLSLKLNEAQQNDLINGNLSMSSILELSKKQIESLSIEIKRNKSVQRWAEAIKEAAKKWEIEAKLAWKEAEQMFSDMSKKVTDSELWKQTSETFSKATETIKEGWFMIWLEKMSKSSWFMWFIAWLILGLFKMFWYNEKIGKLSEINKKEIKSTIRSTLLESFPWKEERIDSLLNSDLIKEEWLENLSEVIKAKGWKINLIDIKESLWISLDSILTEDEIWLAKDRWIQMISKYIEETYNISFNLEPGKREKLRELVSENLQIDASAIHKMNKEQEWRVKDILPLITESGTNLVSFSIWLVTSWIISWSDIIVDVADNYSDSINIGIEALPFTKNITIDGLLEKAEGMSSEEKMLLFQILSRKSALLGSILWHISYYSSWMLIEWITKTSVSWRKLSTQIIAWDIEWQIDSFSKLEKELLKTSEVTDDLREAYNSMSSIKENTIVIKWLNEAKDVETILNNKSIPNKFKVWLDQITDINVAREKVAWLMTFTDAKWSKKMYQHLPWWLNKELQTLQRKVWSIVELQKNIAKWDFAAINKLQSAFEWVNLSRTVDNLVFEWMSKQEAITKMQTLKKIANESPELLRNVISAWWTIWFVWLSLALSNDESFSETMWKEFLLLTRAIWPLSLILDFWVNWEWIKKWNIDTIWAAWAWVWITLFTMDAIWIASILTTTPWAMNKLVATWQFIVKPVTDVVKASASIASQARNIRKLSSAKWVINFWIKDILKWAIETWKNLKINKKLAFAASLWLAAFWVIKYYAYQKDENIESLVEKWVYSADWRFSLENTKKVFSDLSLEEQTIALKSWIQSQLDFDISDIDFKIENWEILASSQNENDTRWNFLYSLKNKELLRNLLGVEKFSFSS